MSGPMITIMVATAVEARRRSQHISANEGTKRASVCDCRRSEGQRCGSSDSVGAVQEVNTATVLILLSRGVDHMSKPYFYLHHHAMYAYWCKLQKCQH